MPTLTIGDKSVNVDDGFLKLSPADQNATVAHIAEQIGAKAPAEAPASPVTANDVVSSAATGVPIIGGALNQLDAATNAALAPVFNRFFAPENQLPEATFAERRAHSLRDLEAKQNKFAADHPVYDTAAQLAGGAAALAPVGATAAGARALGITGPSLAGRIAAGAASGGAIGGADAAVRGGDIGEGAGFGAGLGAAGPAGAHIIGKVVGSVRDQLRPASRVPQNVENIAGVDVPLSGPQVSQAPEASREYQAAKGGARGEAAQTEVKNFEDLQNARMSDAQDAVLSGLDPTGRASRSAQDGAERIAAELLAQEQARQASAAGVHAGPMSPDQMGVDIARSLGRGTAAPQAADAAEILSNRLEAQRNAAREDYRAKYKAVGDQEGGFAPGSASGFGKDVRASLQAGENPVSLDAINTPKSNRALSVIDENLNGAGTAADASTVDQIRKEYGPEVAAAYERQAAAKPAPVPPAPEPPAAAAPIASGALPRDLAGAKPRYNFGSAQYEPRFASDVDKALFITAQVKKSARDADFRSWLKARGYTDQEIARHGQAVRNAIKGRARGAQQGPLPIGRVAPEPAGITPSAPRAHSLNEFLAGKLGPDSELSAIGADNHSLNVEGVGRRKLVKQGGWPLDTALEAATEHGYFPEGSTPRHLLDAIDTEMRGNKLYPAGHEGYVGKSARTAMSEAEQAAHDAKYGPLEDYMSAAGHDKLAPEVKTRAMDLMDARGMDADTAVQHAMHELEAEDQAALSRKPAPEMPAAEAAAAEAPKAERGFTMREVEQVRKQLSTLYGDARRAMLGGGSGADLHALEHIMEAFDQRVADMVKAGKFSGDGPAVLKLQQDARAAFSDYKQKYARRGSGDTVGAAVEKILGKFSDTKATPDEVVRLAYGSAASPGGQMPVQIAQRIAKIFGRDSAEFGTYKQGLFAHLTEGGGLKTADRIDAFLTGTKGRLLAQTAFDAAERGHLAQYAARLRATAAAGEPLSTPSANKVLRDIMGASGTGTGANAPQVAFELKNRLSPEGWNQLRVAAFRELTHAGEGKIPYEAQAMSQRLHEFLNEGGSQLAKVLYSPQELEVMRKLASVYKQMIPVKGTTNPSGTAQMLSKMASGLWHTLLPMFGLTHGGLPGAGLGYLADKVATGARNAGNARAAAEMIYGAGPKTAVNPPRLNLIGATGALNDRLRLQK